MHLCPKCHRMLQTNANFCECGYIYSILELKKQIAEEREEERQRCVARVRDFTEKLRDQVYREPTKVEDTFELDHDPYEEKEEPKKPLPGWMWAKMKKKKKKMDEDQRDIEYRTQLNMFDNTTEGSKNTTKRRKGD